MRFRDLDEDRATLVLKASQFAEERGVRLPDPDPAPIRLAGRPVLSLEVVPETVAMSSPTRLQL